MLILINAIKAITRSKGRNVLILVIVACIAGGASVALAIRQAATTAEAAGLDAITISGTIGLDRSVLMQNSGSSDSPMSPDDLRQMMQQYPALTLEQLQFYADSDYVADFRYAQSISVNAADGLVGLSSEDDPTSDQPSSAGQPAVAGGPQRGGVAIGINDGSVRFFDGRSQGDLTITGYGSEAAMTDFVAGTASITSGAMVNLTASDQTCLVSDELATLNGLAIGDSITVSNPAVDTESYPLTIVGIYHSSATNSAGPGPVMIFSPSQDPANQIITSAKSVQSLVAQSAAVATDTTDPRGQTVSTGLSADLAATYVFATSADFDAFAVQLRERGLDEAYTLSSSDLSNYQASLLPLHNLSSFAQTLLLIVLAVGCVVLVTIAVFAVRERKYEVGVLTAIGIAKPKVALQFLTETLIVTLLGLVVGLGVGAGAAVPIGDSLLSAQVAQQQAQDQSVNSNFGRGPGGAADGGPVVSGSGPRGGFNRAVDYLSEIQASLDWTVVAQMTAIGLGLALLAAAAGVIFVMRYEPLTILANRS